MSYKDTRTYVHTFEGACQDLCGLPRPGYLWHADHIQPVFDGGGLCGVDNIRTLCVCLPLPPLHCLSLPPFPSSPLSSLLSPSLISSLAPSHIWTLCVCVPLPLPLSHALCLPTFCHLFRQSIKPPPPPPPPPSLSHSGIHMIVCRCAVTH